MRSNVDHAIVRGSAVRASLHLRLSLILVRLVDEVYDCYGYQAFGDDVEPEHYMVNLTPLVEAAWI